MRLGELKKTLDEVVNDNNKIAINSKQLYNGQLYNISNYPNLIKALLALKAQSWIDFSTEIVDKLNSKYSLRDQEIHIDPNDYNLLTQCVNNINAKLPVFYGILDTMVKKQHEQIINIKLPIQEDFSLDDLSNINKRLSKIFSSINIDGTTKFSGFDIGTSWYEILIIGGFTYKAFISALHLAQEYYKMKQEYFKSKTEETHYKASLKEGEKETEKGKADYINRVIKIELETKISETVQNLNLDTEKSNIHEVENKIRVTVPLISEEIEKGLEFHLSLNPPEYVDEHEGSVSIDYEELQRLREEENSIKQIEDKTSEEVVDAE